MRPDDLSGSPEAAAQPGSDPGPGQAEHATEYSDDPFAEYTSAYSSGSFTEFIAATSEADIPPFSAEPLPDAMAPGAYGHPAPDAPVTGAPDLYAHDEPDAPGSGAPDVLGYDEPAARSAPDLGECAGRPGARPAGCSRPRWPDAHESGEPDGRGDPAPDTWGQDEPVAPSGGAPDAFGRGGLSSPDRDQSGSYGRGESADSGNDLSGDAADTPVSGFHALIRLPAAPAAERPSPPGARPSPPSERVEWAPRPAWTTPPAEERISTPGEWHIPSRPAAPRLVGSRPARRRPPSPGHWHRRPGQHWPRQCGPRRRGWRDPGCAPGRGRGRDGPDTAVGPAIPGDPLADAGYRRPSRTRLLAAVAAVAILGVTGVTGTLVVMHDHQTVTAVPAATSTAASAAHPGRWRGGVGSASPSPAAPRWSSPVPVDPQTLPASSAHITGLACPKRTVCYATDDAGTVLSLESGGTWPVSNTDANGHLIAISCPSTRFCLTVDAEGFAIPQSHGTWGAPALVGSGSGTLTSVSCTDSSFCVAVDNIGVAFIYRGAATGWSQQTVDPSGQSLNSVSCASSSYCVAVSASGNVFTLQRILMEWAGRGGRGARPGQRVLSQYVVLHGGGLVRSGGRTFRRAMGTPAAGVGGRRGVLPVCGILPGGGHGPARPRATPTVCGPTCPPRLPGPGSPA